MTSGTDRPGDEDIEGLRAERDRLQGIEETINWIAEEHAKIRQQIADDPSLKATLAPKLEHLLRKIERERKELKKTP